LRAKAELYVYASNNPVLLVDPSGLDPNGCTLFSCETWGKLANLSEQYDTGIRLSASLVGLVPIAGGIWEQNILYATGKEDQTEFLIRQAFNAPEAILDAATLGVFRTGATGMKAALQVKTLPKFGIETATSALREATLVAAGKEAKEQAIRGFAIDTLANVVGTVAGNLIRMPSGPVPKYNWASPKGRAILTQMFVGKLAGLAGDMVKDYFDKGTLSNEFYVGGGGGGSWGRPPSSGK